MSFAKKMRHEPVFYERTLWKLLRNRQLGGLKFRRQVRITPYIVDFVCFRHRLIVEADGPFHDPARDAERDAWLTAQGFRVMRFRNEHILWDWGYIIDAILVAAGQASIFPEDPPLRGEGRMGNW